MKNSLENLHSHVDYIEQMNLRLGGLVDAFVKLPDEDQRELLEEIRRLKQNSEKNDEAALLGKIKAMIEFYGVILERAEVDEQSGQEKPLATTLGEIIKNFEGLLDRKKPPQGESIN